MLTGAQQQKRKPDLVDKIVLFGGATVVGWVSIELLRLFFGIAGNDSFSGSIFAFFR